LSHAAVKEKKIAAFDINAIYDHKKCGWDRKTFGEYRYPLG
jgi:hypothetical protein